ncbi:MAG: cyclic pyranopterin monophosphate synthase MoaC [Chloroflexi bacterium]|nr:cyclic pyranopterin monophosphate synthase MoaC [Chloroflexota bacterium]
MTIRICTDGSCLGNPGPGGWASVIEEDGRKRALAGREERTTNNRMELLAAIKGLEAVSEGAEVTLYSDSQYLVCTMARGWKRKANGDLWARLDTLVRNRRVAWEWVRGHAGHPGNEEANALASAQIGLPPESGDRQGPGGPPLALTHVDAQGRAQMVDVGGKEPTVRVAVAKGSVRMKPETLRLVQQGQVEKGDVLAVARVAGILAAKRTAELIPLCHPLPLDQVAVEFEVDGVQSAIHIIATAKTSARTGVEMEALTAVVVAALTIYDMAKAVDRGMRIEAVRLVSKRGGKSGDIVLEP